MLTEHPSGVVLAVKAQPGARKRGIVGVHAGRLKVAVPEPPEDGRANAALAACLAEAFQVRRQHVELLSGPTRAQKAFLILGLSFANAQARLAEIMASL
jgi:uncharacterized protein (TIGR00251 family)